MTPILLHLCLAWIIPSTFAWSTCNYGTGTPAILPSPTFTYALQGPSMTALSYTWAQVITPTTIGTIHVMINTESNSTWTSTEMHTEYASRSSLQTLTRTDTNADRTVTAVVEALDGSKITVAYPTQVLALDSQMTWSAALPTTIQGINETCCLMQQTYSPTPVHSPFPMPVDKTNQLDPTGWLYSLAPVEDVNVTSSQIYSLWGNRSIVLPYTGCHFAPCNVTPTCMMVSPAQAVSEVPYLYDTVTSFVGAAPTASSHVINTEKTTSTTVASASIAEISINSPQSPVATSASSLGASQIQQTTPLVAELPSTEQIASQTDMPASIDVETSSQELPVATSTSEASAGRGISSNSPGEALSSSVILFSQQSPDTTVGVKGSATISTETEIVPASNSRVGVAPLSSMASGTLQGATIISVASVGNTDGQNTVEASANINTGLSTAASSTTTLTSTTRETLVIQSTLTVNPLLQNPGQASSPGYTVNSLQGTTSHAVVQGSLGSSLSNVAASSGAEPTSSDVVSSTDGTSKYHAVNSETITMNSSEGTSTIVVASTTASSPDAISELMTSSIPGQGLPAPSSEQPSGSSDVMSTNAASLQIATTAAAQSIGTPSSTPSITNIAAVTSSSKVGNGTTILPTSVPTSTIEASNDVGHLQATRIVTMTLVVMILFSLF
ncbi:hypothetical protein KCU83_g6073, partial [Aureobasidium melanogenum]